MILKTNSQALEKQNKTLPLGVYPYLVLIKDISSFMQRNNLAVPSAPTKEVGQPIVCERCLKAHSLKRAQELSLPRAIVNMIENRFDCPVGHDGYYIDEDELIKI